MSWLRLLPAPYTNALELLATWRHAALARARRPDASRGDITTGWVLVIALTITIVLGVAAIVATKLNSKANDLDLDTP